MIEQNTANKVTQVIASTLEQRGSVHDVIQAPKDEPDFDRDRARRIVITETLTDASVRAMKPTGNQPLSLASSGYTAEGARISPVRRTSH